MAATGTDIRPAVVPPPGEGPRRPLVWTVAGTDPSGGAGIQADLKTVHGLGAYAASVITAVVAQNSRTVARAAPVGAALVAAQMDALLEEMPPDAVKLGMLATAPIVRAVAQRLPALAAPVICDPVLLSSSGHVLLDDRGMRAMTERILPCTTLLTPNRPEAERLTGLRIATDADAVKAGERLLRMGPGAVLLKGGHAEGAWSCDLLLRPDHAPLWFCAPRLDVRHTHGTGCTLSSALATAHAFGLDWPDACAVARAYLQQGLRLGGGIGRGPGVLFHGAWPSDPQDYPRSFLESSSLQSAASPCSVDGVS